MLTSTLVHMLLYILPRHVQEAKSISRKHLLHLTNHKLLLKSYSDKQPVASYKTSHKNHKPAPVHTAGWFTQIKALLYIQSCSVDYSTKLTETYKHN